MTATLFPQSFLTQKPKKMCQVNPGEPRLVFLNCERYGIRSKVGILCDARLIGIYTSGTIITSITSITSGTKVVLLVVVLTLIVRVEELVVLLAARIEVYILPSTMPYSTPHYIT